ncbi:hypothetical protein D9M71_671760 [compost metagenome]
MTVSEVESVAVQAIAKTVVKNRLRTTGHRRGEVHCEHRFSDTPVSVDNDRMFCSQKSVEDLTVLPARQNFF